MDNRSFLMRCKGNRVYLPMEAAFNPKPSSPYSMVFFPDQIQFFITPFPMEDWTDLWRIKLVLVNAMGLLNEISDILQQLRLNILSETSRVFRGFYHVEFIVSGNRYSNAYDGTTHHRRTDLNRALGFVEAVLMAHFLDRLRFIKIQRGLRGTQHEPDLNIERMREHYNLYFAHDAIDNPDSYSESLQVHVHSDNRHPEEKRNFWIELPARCYAKLLEVTEHTEVAEVEPELTYVASASGRSQIMTLTFLRSDRVWHRIAIEHQDEIGALHAFSHVLPELSLRLVDTATEKIDVKRNRWEFTYESAKDSEVRPEDILEALDVPEVRYYKPKIEVLHTDHWVPVADWSE